MKELRKVFGIVSYFPNNDSPYHIETRRERSRRFRELLFRLEELWPNTDILVIAQNWQDFELPKIKNKIITFEYPDRLGILAARRELRKRFLELDYDYLIMMDDDARIISADPQGYMDEVDKHPDGVGAIRHNNCPLMFFAISKYVYSQIDMPDIEAEKGQGFEDDIFVAQCFAKFPDKAFDFPEGLVVEQSLHYNGPGKCPSSWARENKLDWDYMVSATRSMVSSAKRLAVTHEESDELVDVVIPYVNMGDRNWLSDFLYYTKNPSPNPERYRSWGTLKYLIRGVAKHMPFVRKVFLVVARESQVPAWVNSKTIQVVYHRDFIPQKYLPTFNSCTIEAFLNNIPDISDHFLYFNDDIFPINDLYLDDFFTEDKPHIDFSLFKKFSGTNVYNSQCLNSMNMIKNALHAESEYQLVRPEHCVAAIRKETADKISELCEDQIAASISKMRQTKNINQYIYSLYEYFTDNYVDDICSFVYLTLKDDLSAIKNTILHSHFQLVCLNDSNGIKDYSKTRLALQNIFTEKFPDKCKYEI